MAMEQSCGQQRRAATSGWAGRGEVFLAVAVSRRVLAKPGKPWHVGKHVPSLRPGAGSPALGEVGRRCWRYGPACRLAAGSAACPAASPGAGK